MVVRLPIHGNTQSLKRVPFQIVPGTDQFTPEEPIGQRTIVSIFTQTGKISAHAIDPTDGEDRNGNGMLDSGEDVNGNGMLDPPNGYADTPFQFSTRGEAASQ